MQSLGGTCASAFPHLSPSCTSCSRPYGLNASFIHGSGVSEVNLHSRLLLRMRRDKCSKISRLSRGGVKASSSDENVDPLSSNSTTTTTSESEKDALAAKLAAAEAETEALKKELAVRRAGSRDGDLSKQKISTPEKRIDGTGYREQLFSGPGSKFQCQCQQEWMQRLESFLSPTPLRDQGMDAVAGAKKEPKKWGITEAELFLSKGAPTEGSGLGGPALEAGADAIIKRRLLIGLGITASALALAFIKLPVIFNKPSKPLFFYLTYILRLKNELETLEGTASDAKTVQTRLRGASGSTEELKDNFLSAAALLDGEDVDRASQLSFDVFQYLNQADYNKYFENLGEPTSTQQVEFLKFSLQSIKAARLKIQEYLTLVPSEALEAAKLQLASSIL